MSVGPQPRKPGPVRPWAWPILVGIGLALIGLLGVFEWPSYESEGGQVAMEAPAPTAPPTTVPARAPVLGQLLVDADAFAEGPAITWSEKMLPQEVTSIYGLGEMDGRLALIAATSAPDARKLYPGGAFYLAEQNGEWGSPRWTLPETEQMVAVDIGPGGVVVVTAGRGAARLPYVSTDVTVYASPDGVEWHATPIAEVGETSLVSLNAAVGPAGSTSWVTALTVVDDYPTVTAALPAPIQDLVISRSAIIELDEGRVVVSGPLGFPLFETTLAELGLDDPPAGPNGRRESLAWSSIDSRGFVAAANPAGSEFIATIDRGVDGRLLMLDTGSRVYRQAGGESFEEVGILSNLGFGVAYLQSIGDRVVTVNNQQVEVVTGGTDSIVLRPPQGRGASPYVVPAAGPAGLAVLTGAGGPSYGVTFEPAVIERSGSRVIIDSSERLIRVVGSGAEPESFSALDDTDRVFYEAGSSRLYLGGPPAESDVWVTVDELEQMYIAGLVPRTRGPFGVAFTPDGSRWGWAPLELEPRRPLGPVSLLGVGERDIYAVIDKPQLPNSPRSDSGMTPRLLVGTISG